MSERIFQTGHGRVFLQEKGANPHHAIEYQGLARLSGFSIAEGEPSRVQIPSRLAYDQFENVDEVAGESSLPTTSMIARFGLDNPILRLKCPMQIQVHYGKCEDPEDFTRGWEKILAYDKARFTNRSSDEQTALDEAGRATILLTGDITARSFWEIDRLSLEDAEDSGAADITREVVAGIIADYFSCGECGYESDGENRLFHVTKSSGAGSPGLPAELHRSLDGGTSWEDYDIDTLGEDEQPSDLAKVGSNIVVVSNDSCSMHLADLDDLDAWTEVTTGFSAGNGPNAIWSRSSTQTWIVGDGGYIYFTSNPSQGVSVQSAGAATVQNLLDIHGIDSKHLVAVGATGAIVVTSNGGETWSDLSSDSPTVNDINVVWMRTEYVWLIGTSGGRLYYTKDGGSNWTEITFSLSGQGEVHGISFAGYEDSPFGFMTATDGSKGYIFRTLAGGESWYQLPDTETTTPDNDRLNFVAAGPSGNFVFAGGLKDTDDGIVIVGQ